VRSSRKTADEYLTIEKTHYKHLAIVSKYGINLEKIMEEKQKQNIDDSYLNNWLFYASYSPIWKSRIETYNGKINLEQKRVEFRDDDLEEFYDKYGFEPDEMNMETHHKHGVMLSK
jgi:predicted DNA-binding helix-hairpin-helix protein